MRLTINGTPSTTKASTIAALVEELRLNPRQVAIERNREIVPRSTYAQAQLAEGDAIEVVTFVGGG
ncbi:MAG: sulfur carrier protein ThiS [Alphaproteobacteria bacterium]|nr:sulfur carrier protein ThiS [Alphaproteobacteria bacterium]